MSYAGSVRYSFSTVMSAFSSRVIKALLGRYSYSREVGAISVRPEVLGKVVGNHIHVPSL